MILEPDTKPRPFDHPVKMFESWCSHHSQFRKFELPPLFLEYSSIRFSRICGQAKVMLNLHTMEGELSKQVISPKSHIRGAGKKKIYLLDADADTSTAEANWISDFGAWPAADVWVKGHGRGKHFTSLGCHSSKPLVGQSGEVSIKKLTTL